MGGGNIELSSGAQRKIGFSSVVAEVERLRLAQSLSSGERLGLAQSWMRRKDWFSSSRTKGKDCV